jgi:FKBP-type peptidyl-prolyl cis-trans isomerase SlyD
MIIDNKTIVSLKYTVKNGNGDLIDSNMNGSPVHYLHGSERFIPELNAAITGLKAGDKKSITIVPAVEANLSDKLLIDVIIDNVRAATNEELQTGKYIEPGANGGCGSGCCC